MAQLTEDRKAVVAWELMRHVTTLKLLQSDTPGTHKINAIIAGSVEAFSTGSLNSPAGDKMRSALPFTANLTTEVVAGQCFETHFDEIVMHQLLSLEKKLA
ncbi:unnamed protein product [Clonostachys solani]|uniref:Uncharacterized protein n=1 Tax=Clonostachys solani TaxID=160281 RepID=A0A9P0ECU0_9HYPO|nr:unnamed protein product [Clonostachys solani]